MREHIRQNDRYGCVVACCAIVRGVPYAEVATDLGPPGRGFTHDTWMEYLARHGFAFQFHYQYDCISGKVRDPWPLSPWADLHICSVDAGHGPGSHAVVMLCDGTVLDPAADAPRRLNDYASVAYMAAVYAVGPLVTHTTGHPLASSGQGER
ncbi:hypothetical protein D8770_28315 [Methylobacterium sp. DB1607]|nr:hypothetical protein [Methylobacterium sp. DB1607]